MAEIVENISRLKLPGLVLDYPLGLLVLLGKKRMSLHKKRVIKHLNKPVYLIENGHVLGVIRLSNERVVSRQEALRLSDAHGLREEDLDKYFPETNSFYLYDLELLYTLPRPLPVEVKKGGLPWVPPEGLSFARSLGEKLKILELREESPQAMAESLLIASELLDLLPEDVAELSPCEVETLRRIGERLLSGEELQNFLAVLEEGTRKLSLDRPLEVPSEKDGPKVAKREPVLELLSPPAMLYHNAVCLVGSLASEEEGHDVDILVRSEVPREVFRRVAFRLGRVLNTLGVPIHILWDDGPFTPFVPLYDIWLVPSRSREVIAMARQKTLEPFKPVETMKPVRIGLGAPQTKENFLALVEEYGPEGYLEPKYDGVCIFIHKKGNEIKAWTEDGEEITGLIETLDPFNTSADFIIQGELESWDEDWNHLPREFTAGHLHARRSARWTVTVFEILYLDEDIHDWPREDRLKLLQELAEELGWELRKPRPRKPGIYLGQVFPVETCRDVAERMEEILKHKEYEGVVWKKKDGQYYLDGNPRKTQVKWHRSVRLQAVVVDRHETKTPGVFNYTWGLPVEDPEKWSDIEEINGKKIHVSGKTFSTNLKFDRGDVIELELETLTVERQGRKFRIGGWAPKIVKEVQGD